MTPIWRYLTKPAGMTAQQLADATGLTINQARADLAQLEKDGKARRRRAAVGQPHVWWRAGCQPLEGFEVLLHMALAAHHNRSAEKLKEVLVDIGRRALDPAHKKLMLMCASSKTPHSLVWHALNEYEPEAAAQKAA